MPARPPLTVLSFKRLVCGCGCVSLAGEDSTDDDDDEFTGFGIAEDDGEGVYDNTETN